MPARTHPSAPRFNGDGRQLKRYFKDVEELLRGAQIFDLPTRVYHAKRYADPLDAESWIGANIAAATTWDQWKEAVIALYPEASEDWKYSYGNLDRLTQEFRKKGIFAKTELGNYHRRFKAISDFLLGKGRVSQTQINLEFPKGFHDSLRTEVEARLKQ
ncbi:hypothetical protein K474DRAFT_1609064 [Panus rudis PR-1116 ss-1]|nr:hypothetical protein K474DRAFT_1609064 [Panus rudis PR-1116 ss-1]